LWGGLFGGGGGFFELKSLFENNFSELVFLHAKVGIAMMYHL
jgi:hypothetical protein